MGSHDGVSMMRAVALKCCAARRGGNPASALTATLLPSGLAMTPLWRSGCTEDSVDLVDPHVGTLSRGRIAMKGGPAERSPEGRKGLVDDLAPCNRSEISFEVKTGLPSLPLLEIHNYRAQLRVCGSEHQKLARVPQRR